MKSILYIFSLVVLFSVGLTSCYEQDDWLSDNTTTEGRHFPVIAEFFVLNPQDSFDVNDEIRLDLRYWSVDDIEVINMYATPQGGATMLVNSYPYSPNFQEDTQTDQLTMSYTVPSGVSGEVRLDAEIVNQNGLVRNTNVATSASGNRPSVTIVVR